MKSKHMFSQNVTAASKRFAGIFAVICFLCAALYPLRCSAADAQELLDGLTAYELAQSNADSVQEWIDAALTQNAGMTSEWYILALSQSGESYDFSAYRDALTAYLSENTVSSAVTRQKYAFVYLGTGSNDAYIAEVTGNSIGEMGIMSWVFGLHLLHNGCTGSPYTEADAVQNLLALQLPDGGWAVSGERSDVDVTAMTLQALAPHSAEYPEEIGNALDFLSASQLPGGDFASYGVPNPESTAQVLTALVSLGIDPLTDARFVKNGSTPLDGIAAYRLPDGSFSHTLGGTVNQNACAQVFFALNALQQGRNPYLFTAPVSASAQWDGRVTVTLCILGAGGLLCLVQLCRNKRGMKHYLVILLAAAAGIAIVWLVRIESAEEYYQPDSTAEAEIIGTVTLSIRADTVAGRAEHLPADGVLLGTTEFPLAEGDTVFDLLTRAAQEHSLHFEYSGTPELAYVQGIGNLYEFEYGDLSGWVYRVNGTSPSVGCGACTLQDGDAVEWHYTLDLGKDVAQ